MVHIGILQTNQGHRSNRWCFVLVQAATNKFVTGRTNWLSLRTVLYPKFRVGNQNLGRLRSARKSHASSPGYPTLALLPPSLPPCIPLILPWVSHHIMSLERVSNLPSTSKEGAPLHVIHAVSPFVQNTGTVYVFITAYVHVQPCTYCTNCKTAGSVVIMQMGEIMFYFYTVTCTKMQQFLSLCFCRDAHSRLVNFFFLTPTINQGRRRKIAHDLPNLDASQSTA